MGACASKMQREITNTPSYKYILSDKSTTPDPPPKISDKVSSLSTNNSEKENNFDTEKYDNSVPNLKHLQLQKTLDPEILRDIENQHKEIGFNEHKEIEKAILGVNEEKAIFGVNEPERNCS